MSRVRNLVDFNVRTSDFDGDTNDDVTFNNVVVNDLDIGGTFTITNAGNTTFTAGANLTLDATNRVIIQDTPFKLANMTTTVRDALSSPADGDLIYNSTTNKVEARENGAWVQVSAGGGGGGSMNDVVDDTTPQLGGNLDVNGNSIVNTDAMGTVDITSDGMVDITANNGDVEISATGGTVEISGDTGNIKIESTYNPGMIHLKSLLGPTRIESSSAGTGKGIGNSGIYLMNDSTSIGSAVMIGLHPGTDSSTSVDLFSFIKTTRESNYSSNLSINTKYSVGSNWYTTTFGGDDDFGNVEFPTSIGTKAIREKVTIDATTTGAYNFEFSLSSVVFFDTDQTNNRGLNFRWNSVHSLDSVLAVGESITAAVLFTQGATPYYVNVYQVDGVAVTPEWQGGSAPSAGNANSIDVYSFTIIKTAVSTFKCLASQTQYA